MRATHFAAALYLAAAASWSSAQEPPPAPEDSPTAADPSPRQLFETNCGACHSLDLPESQHLDRQTWRWVVTDMVEQFGATWITPEQQGIIVEYLAENYGPER